MAHKKSEKVICEPDPARSMTVEEIKAFLWRCKPAVYQDMECRVCRWYCQPPFIACEGTHLICKACHKKKNVCVICGTTDRPVALPFLETIFDILEFPCVNEKHGCQYRGNGFMIKYHEQDCHLYKTKCLDPTCDWEGKPGKIFRHYRKSHPSKIEKDLADRKHIIERTETEINKIITNILKRYDHSFMVQIIVSPKAECVRLVGTNFEPFKKVTDYCLSVNFMLKDGSVWEAEQRFIFNPNGEEIDSKSSIRYGEEGELKEKTKRFTDFDHNIKIELRPINPFSGDETNDDDDDDDDEYSY